MQSMMLKTQAAPFTSHDEILNMTLLEFLELMLVLAKVDSATIQNLAI